VDRPRPARRTSDAEFDALAQLCEQLSGFGEPVHFDVVDGFLAALVCAPVRPSPERWVPALFGDAFERACADPEARAGAMAVLQARIAVLEQELDPDALALDPDRLRLEPLLPQPEPAGGTMAGAAGGQADEGEAGEGEAGEGEAGKAGPEGAPGDVLAEGAFWSDGFLSGLDHFGVECGLPAPGAADDEELQQLLDPLLALTRPAEAPAPHRGGLPPHPAPGAAAADPAAARLDEALFAVQDLRLWWLDRAPRHAPRRVEAAPGRNDPCPCGSGRKYKKCHGAAA
jgi:uncharacterized protein